ncbi:MAG: hypothetical protein V3U82_04490, partial [Robiginitomaculum sp.]
SRMGAWNIRGSDVSVTMDLLIHDADLVLSLFSSDDFTVTKASAKMVHTRLPDEISADIVMADGGSAHLISSRTHDGRDRKMIIDYPSGRISIDFVARTFENSTGFDINEDFASTEIGGDPLGANVTAFIEAAMGLREGPVIDGEAGLRALKLVRAIDRAAGF